MGSVSYGNHEKELVRPAGSGAGVRRAEPDRACRYELRRAHRRDHRKPVYYMPDRVVQRACTCTCHGRKAGESSFVRFFKDLFFNHIQMPLGAVQKQGAQNLFLRQNPLLSGSPSASRPAVGTTSTPCVLNVLSMRGGVFDWDDPGSRLPRPEKRLPIRRRCKACAPLSSTFPHQIAAPAERIFSAAARHARSRPRRVRTKKPPPGIRSERSDGVFCFVCNPITPFPRSGRSSRPDCPR